MALLLFPDLKKRSSLTEIMDEPDCDRKKLINTVKQFEMLNFLFTGSRRLIKKYIIPVIKKDPLKEYTFLDIGAGGCDIALWFARFCRKKNYRIRITCIDNDPAIFEYAAKKCGPVKEITVIRDSAGNLKKYGKYDFIFANHFLHHLNDNDIPGIINLICSMTGILFLMNDIRRSIFAYLGYTLVTAIFFHNSFAFYDGRLSIRKGFTYKELQKLIKGKDVNVIRFFPFRLVLTNIRI